MTGDPGIGSPTEESDENSPQKRQQEDLDYCRPYTFPDRRYISPETMQRIVALLDRNRSEKSIRGEYPWFRRQYADRFRRCLNSGSLASYKMDQINDYVLREVNAHRWSENNPLHEYMLRRWGLERAREIGADFFKASSFWIHSFKKRNRIVSRKVTKFRSRSEIAQQQSISDSHLSFANKVTDLTVTSITAPHLLFRNQLPE